jgi:hypothetical protein
MISLTRNEYLTHRLWFDAVTGSEDVILRRTSALECLQLFVGYVREREIDVYAKTEGPYENINYHIVESFDGIEYVWFGNVKCTSVNQTFNDMLADYDNIDEQSLFEAIGNYYHAHNRSLDGLDIRPENQALFDLIKNDGIEYFNC